MGPDARGEYLCMYCGTRFHRTSTVPAPAPGPIVVHVPAPASKSNAAGLLIAAGLVGLIGAGTAYFLLLAPKEVSVGEKTRPTPEPAPLPTPIHTPPSTISTPVAIPEAPEPEPTATANFEFHQLQSGYQTSFYALGFVTNTSPFVIDKPKVIAVLLDRKSVV